MSIKLTAESFLSVVRKSRLVDADRLERLMQDFQTKGIDVSKSAIIADELVATEVLTRWQADRLMTGDHAGLYLGRYRLLDLLGEGGMSQVYLAQHDMIGQKCAIKVLTTTHLQDSSKLARFHREAQAVSSLSHPNIVRAQHFDTQRSGDVETHYLVMEYVDGQNLHDIVKNEGPLSFVDAAHYICQAADGLANAHQAGFVHRDIKPGNLVMNNDGVVKILDLGLVRIAEEKDVDPLTVAYGDTMLGTFDFMAPEQALESHSVDARADIYSLGCTLYFTLTGHVPFNQGTMAQRLMWQQMKDPPSITESCPDAPATLVSIVERMMKKLPDDRYQTADEVVAALEDWLIENADEDWKRRHPGLDAKRASRRDDAATLTEVVHEESGEESGQSPPPTGAEQEPEFEDAETPVSASGSTVEVPASHVVDPQDSPLPDNGKETPTSQTDTTTTSADLTDQKTTITEPAVGIDLGTTSSVVAYLDSFGRPATVRNAEGERTTPSVVYFDEDAPLVGMEAVSAAEFEPERIAQFVKRELGATACQKAIRGEHLPPEVVQALVLRKVWHDAELELGRFKKAVITVPAFFDEPRREATLDAARLAGIEVIDILNEPTAAAINYGIQQGFLNAKGESEKRETVLVYDLGGGSFDATLMQIDGRNYTCLGTRGDVQLGGIDWDERIIDFLAGNFELEFGIDPRNDEANSQTLRHNAVEAKHALSTRNEAAVHVALEGRRTRITLTRVEFETATKDLLDRTLARCRELLEQTDRQWSDLTQLVLVGGATRMPMVQEALAQESGLKIDRSLSPDEGVAQGAAIYAGSLLGSPEVARHGISVQNVSSHDLGILVQDTSTGRMIREILVPRNTPLPASSSKTFVTAKDGQEKVSAFIVEGGNDDASGCTKIAKCIVMDFPLELPSQTPVEVIFNYTQDSRLMANAWLPTLNRKVTVRLIRKAGLNDTTFATWSNRLEAGLSDDSASAQASKTASNEHNQAD